MLMILYTFGKNKSQNNGEMSRRLSYPKFWKNETFSIYPKLAVIPTSWVAEQDQTPNIAIAVCPNRRLPTFGNEIPLNVRNAELV